MARRSVRAGASLLGLVLAGSLLAGTAIPVRRRQPGRRSAGHHEEPDRVRVGRRGGQRGSGGDRGRTPGAAGRWQRRRRRGGHGGGARGDRALLRRHRWRWLLRLLRREDPSGADHRRSGDRAAEHARDRVHRPEHRAALSVRAAGDQREVGRRARHPGHLGAGPAALGTEVARLQPAAGHQDRQPRLRGGRDVPRPDAAEQGPVRRDHADREALPPRRRRAGRRLDLPQPRPRRHLPGDRPGRVAGDVPGSDRRRDRPDRAAAAEGARRRAARLARVPAGVGSDGVPGARPGTDHGPLPRTSTCSGWRPRPRVARRSARP